MKQLTQEQIQLLNPESLNEMKKKMTIKQMAEIIGVNGGTIYQRLKELKKIRPYKKKPRNRTNSVWKKLSPKLKGKL